MLPIIPIVVGAASAAILIRRKFKKAAQNADYKKLLAYAEACNIPVGIDGHFNPDALLPNGMPILFQVIIRGELLQTLLEYGANPNICNAQGVPAIIFAVTQLYASEKPVSLLLKYGANPNAMDSEGKTAIFYAKDPDMLKLLCGAGALINAVDCDKKSALFYSFENHTTRALTELGVDTEIRDKDGKTALFYAVSKRDLELLQWADANFDAADNSGKTALFYSFTNKTTLYLLQYGANPNARDCEGKTAIFYITGEEDFPTIFEMENYGVKLDARDNNDNRFAYYSRYKEYKMNRLNGGKPPKSKEELNHDLYVAVLSNRLIDARHCLDLGADPTIQSENCTGWNLINTAVVTNNPAMIQLLYEAGADINNNNTQSTSPLQQAVYRNKVECFKKLLELGADPSSAWSAVRSHGSDEIKRTYQHYLDNL